MTTTATADERRSWPDPPFLTNKLTIEPLGETRTVHDYQLREHFVTTENLYTLRCACSSHKHQQPCIVVMGQTTCPKCGTPTQPLIEYQALLFHPQLSVRRLGRCCRHIHEPPCHRCPNCSIGQACMVKGPFECDVTTDAVCTHRRGDQQQQVTLTNTNTDRAVQLHEHVYDTRMPIFYFCDQHAHYHRSQPDVRCTIWVGPTPCCERAVAVNEYGESFVVRGTIPRQATTSSTAGRTAAAVNADATVATTTTNTPRSRAAKLVRGRGAVRSSPLDRGRARTKGNRTLIPPPPGYRTLEWIIYSPAIWRDQPFNHFVSFVRACIASPEVADERYKRFAQSTFQIPPKAYVSGKDSFFRSSITGFLTEGVYQTSTISCTVRPDTIVVPQTMYDQMSRRFVMDLALVKRDPSIQQTCLCVMRIMRNSDPTVLVTIISDLLAKGFNQDQDGDRNAQYLLRRTSPNGFSATETYWMIVARYEMATAFRKGQTLIATARQRLSEAGQLAIWTSPESFDHLESFRRIRHRSSAFIDEAYAGYYAGEQCAAFQAALRRHFRTERARLITAGDLLLEERGIHDVVDSGAKGTPSLVQMLLHNLGSGGGGSVIDHYDDMRRLNDTYISSSRDLSASGRRQFAALCGEHDLVVVGECLSINGTVLANLGRYASFGYLWLNQSTLELLVSDLVRQAAADELLDDLGPGRREAMLAALDV